MSSREPSHFIPTVQAPRPHGRRSPSRAFRWGWRRVAPLGCAILFGCGNGNTSVSRGQATEAAAVTTTLVTDRIHLLQGATWNVLAATSEHGVLLVDAAPAPASDALLGAIEKLQAGAVRAVVNTHYHADHTGGNAHFDPGVQVIAHTRVRARLSRGGPGGNYGSDRYEHVARTVGLPSITFDSELALHWNGEPLEVLHFGESHTDGDAVVLFPDAKVICMGDLYVTYGFPSIDLMNGGTVAGMIATLDTLIARLPDDVKVVPGHGPVSTLLDVRRFADMLRETSAAVTGGIEAGKTLQSLQEERVLEPWEQWAGYFSSEVFTETLYNDQVRPGAVPVKGE
jgi:cyclase